MTSEDGWSREAALVAFDVHLRRGRGLCAGTRRNYCRFVGLFLEATFADRRVEVGEIGAGQVIEFISGAANRYQPKTVELVATSLRVFFRFARAEGLRPDRLDDAVPRRLTKNMPLPHFVACLEWRVSAPVSRRDPGLA